MILIFLLDLPFLKCIKFQKDDMEEQKFLFSETWDDIVFNSSLKISEVEAIAYYITMGGNEITEPIQRISTKILSSMERSIKFMPEVNNIIFKIAEKLFNRFPTIPQFLICETAYFINLPLEASIYAVPYSLYASGVRRYGGDGIIHQWVAEQMQDYRRIISIHLGSATNIAAIKDGNPVESTLGFSSVEGLPSMHSCGDIDPTIIFQLLSEGMSLNEINQILTRRSGFAGFLGKEFDDIVFFKNSNITDILKYKILQYIGSFISIMGGVESIVFFSEDLGITGSFILKICRELKFLGVRCRTNFDSIKKTLFEMSLKDSQVKIFCAEYSKWRILYEKIKNYCKEEQNA